MRSAFGIPRPVRVNVQGSRNVVHAAAAAGVRRVVYTSSAAALGEELAGRLERRPRHTVAGSCRATSARSSRPSGRSADRGARGRRSTSSAEIRRPSRVRPRHGLDPASARLPERKLKAIVESTISLVDIADCTEGHLLAEARGEPGSGTSQRATLTVREDPAARPADRHQRAGPRLAARLATAAAVAVETAARLRGKTPASAATSSGPRSTATPTTDRGPRASSGSATPLEETIRRTSTGSSRRARAARPSSTAAPRGPSSTGSAPRRASRADGRALRRSRPRARPGCSSAARPSSPRRGRRRPRAARERRRVRARPESCPLGLELDERESPPRAVGDRWRGLLDDQAEARGVRFLECGPQSARRFHVA